MSNSGNRYRSNPEYREKQKAYQRERYKRIKADPVLNEHLLEIQRVWRKLRYVPKPPKPKPEPKPKLSKEQKRILENARSNERNKRRYRNDPEYREKVKQRSREYYFAHRDEKERIRMVRRRHYLKKHYGIIIDKKTTTKTNGQD